VPAVVVSYQPLKLYPVLVGVIRVVLFPYRKEAVDVSLAPRFKSYVTVYVLPVQLAKRTVSPANVTGVWLSV
jgi:hypothetical protein